MDMAKHIRGDKPDYMAMADMLERIAQELRLQAAEKRAQRDLEQAERLERIAAEIKANDSA